MILRPLIRQGRVEERLALEELQRRAWTAFPDLHAILAENPDIVALARVPLMQGQVMVAEEKGVVLGYSLVVARGPRVEMEGLFVEPAHWRQGIGRALVEAACRTLAGAGGGRLETVANPRVEDFYLRLGFEPAGRALTAFGPARRMARAVAPAT